MVSLTSAFPGGVGGVIQLQENLGFCTGCHPDCRVAIQPSGQTSSFFCLGAMLIQMAFSQSSE